LEAFCHLGKKVQILGLQVSKSGSQDRDQDSTKLLTVSNFNLARLKTLEIFTLCRQDIWHWKSRWSRKVSTYIWDRDRDRYRSWSQLVPTVQTSLPNKYIQNYLTSEVDPFLVSIYSLSFPIAFVNSVLSPEDFQRSRSVFKSTYKFLTISGNLVLLLSLAAVTFLVQTNELKHFPQIRIRRDYVRH